MAMEDLIKTVKPNYSIQVLINHVATLNISQLFRQLSLSWNLPKKEFETVSFRQKASHFYSGNKTWRNTKLFRMKIKFILKLVPLNDFRSCRVERNKS